MFEDKYRYVLLVVGFLCLTSMASNYVIMNFTFICMKDDITEIIHDNNQTEIIRKFDYTPTEKSMIVWAVAIGTIIGTTPVNWCYIKYGARWPFFIAGVCSIISTAFMPLAAELGLYYLLFCRFVQGLAYSADFAAIGIICVRWAPIGQTAFFIAVLTTFTTAAPSLTNPIAGWLCESSLGWRYGFYTHAAFGVLVFGLWILLYTDDPQTHPYISPKELEWIQKDKSQAHIERDSFCPFWEIIKNKVILIIWANAFVEMVGVTLLLTYAPIYFHSVLGYSVTTTGLLVSATAAIHAPIKIFFGAISDAANCISEKLKMVVFNTIAVGVCGLVCILLGIIPIPIVSVVGFAAVFSCMSLNPGGFYKCASLTARQYAHFVLAMIQFMKCLALFVAPSMVAIFVSDESDFYQWRYVFFTMAALLLIANALFYTIVTDKPAAFTLITRESVEKERSASCLKENNNNLSA